MVWNSSRERPTLPVHLRVRQHRSEVQKVYMTIAFGKRGKLPRTRGVRKGNPPQELELGEIVELDSEGQESWDEDDVMLFCWGNTPAAKERHRKKRSGDYSAYGVVESKCGCSWFSLISL